VTVKRIFEPKPCKFGNHTFIPRSGRQETCDDCKAKVPAGSRAAVTRRRQIAESELRRNVGSRPPGLEYLGDDDVSERKTRDIVMPRVPTSGVMGELAELNAKRDGLRQRLEAHREQLEKEIAKVDAALRDMGEPPRWNPNEVRQARRIDELATSRPGAGHGE
jgi:hypothetical protein